MSDVPMIPVYDDAIAYYLRDDVADVLVAMSDRRPMRFYYHTTMDFSRHFAKADAIALSCVGGRDAFRARILAAVRSCGPSATPFVPFFGMNPAVNAPGEPGRPVGWDMRLEFDHDLAGSFRALIPVMALFAHFDVPILGKFSGHRSLHVLVPAEAFPPRMRDCPNHGEWMATFERLGGLLCHISPPLARTMAMGSAKSLPLTAPYSLHRYRGGVSIPVGLDEAFAFDPAVARLDAFPGVRWLPVMLDGAGDRMEPILDLAARSERDPAEIVAVAEEIYRGECWCTLAEGFVPLADRADPILSALMAGMPGIERAGRGLATEVAARLCRMLAVIDDAAAKNMRVHRLVRSMPVEISHIPVDEALALRRIIADAFAPWVRGGLGEAIPWLLRRAGENDLAASVAFAVRIFGLLPEPADAKIDALRAKWSGAPTGEGSVRLFLALALAEIVPIRPDALAAFALRADAGAEANTESVRGEIWRTEDHPDRAVAALRVAFGRETVAGWVADADGAGREVVRRIFGGNAKKFVWAAR